VGVYGSDGPSGEFWPNFDLKIYDVVLLCKGFFTKEKKEKTDPSSPDFEFFFSNRQIF
jgi:hypothetical protein